MKKILTTKALKRLYLENHALIDRADVSVITTETNDEMLEIHRRENAHLIITTMDLPGMRSEKLFQTIRQSVDLRNISIIMICENNRSQQDRCLRCGANAVFTMPVQKEELHSRALQLLDIAPRRPYRVALNVAVEGKFNNKPFLHRTEDISATGMLIKARNVLARGDSLSFSFYLPGGVRVSARGEVERTVKHASEPDVCLYGVKFTDMDASTRSAIEDFVLKELQNKRPIR